MYVIKGHMYVISFILCPFCDSTFLENMQFHLLHNNVYTKWRLSARYFPQDSLSRICARFIQRKDDKTKLK
jgi:hypothetical protein